ncbi:DUF5713 family protein [Streptomyces vinaceus]|uniref:DUF5713 family protein n=1 Tax=Streptomyces vinaceus TaxID=1960 RepID=UPI0037F39C5D
MERLSVLQMYADSYVPERVVDQGRAILLWLCEGMEAEQPLDLTSLYGLTQAATEEFNLLDRELVADGAGSRRLLRTRPRATRGSRPGRSAAAAGRPGRFRRMGG